VVEQLVHQGSSLSVAAFGNAVGRVATSGVGAELLGEDVRARVLHAEPLDDAAAKT
jgi:hypothetical protein